MELTDMSELDSYPVIVHIPIQWGNMDSFNHVNNTQFFRYYETARIKYFEDIGLIDIMKETSIGPILAKTSSHFLKPITYPDNVTVGAKVISIGNTSFVMDYVIYSEKKGLSARGDGVIVIFDYKNSKKVQVPPEIIQAIRKIENKDL